MKNTLDYQTAYNAVHGDKDAKETVLKFYDGCINAQAMIEVKNPDGSTSRYVDKDIKAEIQTGYLAALSKNCRVMKK